MIVVGVTGGLGTGKSTVARIFQQLGAVVLDADRIAHEVMRPKQLAWRRIVTTFGEQVLNDDQTINRALLARRVFREPAARVQLETIVHPQVIRHIRARLRQLSRNRRVRVVVLDVPLLAETGMHTMVDAVVVVSAPREVARERLIARGLNPEEAQRRIAAQWDLAAKVALADHVVDNADGMEHTRRQVKQLWNQLVAAKHRRRG